MVLYQDRIKKIIFVCILMIAVIYAGENDTRLSEKTSDLGFSGGMILSGEINAEDLQHDFEKTSSFMIKGCYDSYLIPKLATGLYIHFAPVTIEEKDTRLDVDSYYDENLGEWQFIEKEVEEVIDEHSGTMLEIGGTIKRRFIVNQKIAIKPGIYLGYRKFFSDTEELDSHGMALNGACEFQYLYSARIILSCEIGFITQPYGGKEDVTHIDFGPILYFALGFVL